MGKMKERAAQAEQRELYDHRHIALRQLKTGIQELKLKFRQAQQWLPEVTAVQDFETVLDRLEYWIQYEQTAEQVIWKCPWCHREKPGVSTLPVLFCECQRGVVLHYLKKENQNASNESA